MRGGLFHSIIFFNYKGFYLLNNSINYQSDDTRLFTKDFDVFLGFIELIFYFSEY